MDWFLQYQNESQSSDCRQFSLHQSQSQLLYDLKVVLASILFAFILSGLRVVEPRGV